ncbi:uncharacterized protein LOC135500165 [Lineus longissimus]|uniref:uncharacterized protein LOC135500165 n=1 Tax=Lineus longissimus TaxID=88925 RepID=UPI00315C83A1
MATANVAAVIKELKKRRSYAKGQLTRKLNNLYDLMSDPNYHDNVERITLAAKEVGNHFQFFSACHNGYHQSLVSPHDIELSQDYSDGVVRVMCRYRDDLAGWIDGQLGGRLSPAVGSVSEDNADDDQPQESVSSISLGDGSSSRVSGSSRSSTATKARMAAAADRAAIDIEASILEERQALEKQEFELSKERERLELKVKLAKARAKEDVCSSMSDKGSVASSKHSNKSFDINRPLETSKLSPFTTPFETKATSRPNQLVKCAESADPRQSTPVGVESGRMHVADIPTETAISVPDDSRPNVAAEVNNEARDVYTAQQGEVTVSQQDNSALPDALLQVLDQGQKQQQLLLDTIQLPKVDLMTFDGDPSKYCLFIRSFENSVDKQTIDDSIKLGRLVRFCTGKARRVIESCSVKEPTVRYQLARKLLKERFGNDFVVSQTWVDKIVNRKPVRASDPEALRDLADDMLNCVETLTAMKRLDSFNETSLVQIVEKLPLYLQNKWKAVVRKIRQENRSPTIQDTLIFVSRAAEEANDPVFGKCGTASKDTRDDRQAKGAKDKSKSFGKTTFGTQVGPEPTQRPKKCAACDGNHWLHACNKFKAMQPPDRLEFARKAKLCTNSFRSGNFASRCSKPSYCDIAGCERKYSKLLHFDKTKPTTNPDEERGRPVPRNADARPPNIENHCSFNGAGVTRSRVALPIVPVKVRGRGSVGYVKTYALLDSGSNRTFCSDDWASQLDLSGMKKQVEVTTLEKKNSVMEAAIYQLDVTDLDENEVIELPSVVARPDLHISPTIMTSQDLDKYSHLEKLEFPVIEPRKVQLLIGQDVPEALMPVDIRRGARGEPYATKTALGWTLNDPIGVDRHATSNFIGLTSHWVQADVNLQKQVEKLWKLENLTGDEQGMSIEDKRVISLWDARADKVNGHYQLPIPFKYSPPHMSNNYSMAVHRLNHLGRKFTRTPDLHQRYKAEIATLLGKGYAEEVTLEEMNRKDGMVWYLPHHPVINPKKPEKLRIVFDCAAQWKGTSLNQQILQGPDLANKLVGVLLRFRQERVAMMADVEGMFNQVLVQPDHRDVLRFLWWDDDDPTKEVKVYRMKITCLAGSGAPAVPTMP